MKRFCLLFIYLSLVCLVQGQTTNYGNNSKAAKYYNVRGINIYTEQYGTGKPLVLIHGNGGSISSMASIIPYFSKQYRVIAVDSRAHGKTIDTKDSLSFEMMADDVAALLDKMNISSAYVIGWSDGGIVAIEMAMRHPQKVIKFASTGANLVPDSTALVPSLWDEMKNTYQTKKRLPKKTANEKRQWKYFMLDWQHPHISFSELHKIKTPSLIISGDHDIIRLEHTVKIFQNIPKAQLWIVPNSGHATLIEHQADFCRTVNEFLMGKK